MLLHRLKRRIQSVARRCSAAGLAARVDPARFIQALSELHAQHAAGHRVRLLTRAVPDMATVRTDAQALHGLLSHLLAHAIEHSQASLVLLSAEPVSAASPACGTRFFIDDNGSGMDAQALRAVRDVLAGRQPRARPWTPAWLRGWPARWWAQRSRARPRPEAHWARALQMARKISATLSIDSEPDKGTSVTIALLPARRASKAGIRHRRP